MEYNGDKRLAEAMRKQNITATELGNLTGISKSDISKYVNGRRKISLKTAKRIAPFLDISPSWLLGMSGDPLFNPSSATRKLIPVCGASKEWVDGELDNIVGYYPWEIEEGDPNDYFAFVAVSTSLPELLRKGDVLIFRRANCYIDKTIVALHKKGDDFFHVGELVDRDPYWEFRGTVEQETIRFTFDRCKKKSDQLVFDIERPKEASFTFTKRDINSGLYEVIAVAVEVRRSLKNN